MVESWGDKNPKSEGRNPKEGRIPKSECIPGWTRVRNRSLGSSSYSFSPDGTENQIQLFGFTP
jgi:hypothetical protein